MYGFAQMDWNFQDESKPLVDLSRLITGKFFNNNYVNGFMMVNVVLGLCYWTGICQKEEKSFTNGVTQLIRRSNQNQFVKLISGI